MIKQPSCGFGESIPYFYKDVKSTALNGFVRNCLGNSIYGQEDASYLPQSYSPDILMPPWGKVSFGKQSILKSELKYLLTLNVRTS